MSGLVGSAFAQMITNQEFTQEEIDKMKREADENESEDKARKEEVETHNQAEQLIYQTESQMKELADKIDDSDKTNLDTALNDLKEKNSSTDISSIPLPPNCIVL